MSFVKNPEAKKKFIMAINVMGFSYKLENPKNTKIGFEHNKKFGFFTRVDEVMVEISKDDFTKNPY
jgi:hypothetical protein